MESDWKQTQGRMGSRPDADLITNYLVLRGYLKTEVGGSVGAKEWVEHALMSL